MKKTKLFLLIFFSALVFSFYISFLLLKTIWIHTLPTLLGTEVHNIFIENLLDFAYVISNLPVEQDFIMQLSDLLNKFDHQLGIFVILAENSFFQFLFSKYVICIFILILHYFTLNTLFKTLNFKNYYYKLFLFFLIFIFSFIYIPNAFNKKISILAFFSEINPDIFTYWQVLFMIFSSYLTKGISIYLIFYFFLKKKYLWFFIPCLIYFVPFSWNFYIENTVLTNFSNKEIRNFCKPNYPPSFLEYNCLPKLLKKNSIILNSHDYNWSQYFILNGSGNLNSIISPNVIFFDNPLLEKMQFGAINNQDQYTIINNKIEPLKNKLFLTLNDHNTSQLKKIIKSTSDIGLRTFSYFSLYSYYQKNYDLNNSFKIITDFLNSNYGLSLEKGVAADILKHKVNKWTHPFLQQYLLKNWNTNYQSDQTLVLKKLTNLSQQEFINFYDDIYINKEQNRINNSVYNYLTSNLSEEFIKKTIDTKFVNNGFIKGQIILNDLPFSNQKIALHSFRQGICSTKFTEKIDAELLNKCSKLMNKINSEIQPINMTITDNDGNFSFNNIPQGLYFLLLADFNKEKEYLEKQKYVLETNQTGIIINQNNLMIDIGVIKLKQH